MKTLRFFAASLAALTLSISAPTFAHETAPSEKVTVLQDQMLKNAPGKKALMIEVDYEPAGSEHLVSKNASATQPAKLLVFMVLAPDEKVLIPLEN
ncbi:hypothetical protein PMI18_03147 [Pseudomonas sp. GM102]|uniref:hypothetical protein n=1 Tax=Pseudomonas sp. GM102 TaxID=1144321 RepID=UPI00026F8982|nr:hypothetical protein [Pseudomonas sp. GM102]EJM00048.1 hypothetical protein PMI18_03147 [Pseudomonas sp. GM102]